MIDQIAPLISYKRGSTNFFRKFFYRGEEIGEIEKRLVEGKLKWQIDEIIEDTFEKAAATYIIKKLLF